MKNLNIFILAAFLIFLLFFALDFILTLFLVAPPFIWAASTAMFAASILAAAVFTVVIAPYCARLYGKKTGEYVRRIWEQIAILFLIGTAVNYTAKIFLSPFMLTLGLTINNPILEGAVIKIPLLAVYLIAVYNVFSRFGLNHAHYMKHNTALQTVTVIMAYLIITPYVVHDHMFTIINLHSALAPTVPVVNYSVSIVLMIGSVTLTFLAEASVIMLAYADGKKACIARSSRPEGCRTDEIHADGETLSNGKTEL